jgi:hypothetical protein
MRPPALPNTIQQSRLKKTMQQPAITLAFDKSLSSKNIAA